MSDQTVAPTPPASGESTINNKVGGAILLICLLFAWMSLREQYRNHQAEKQEKEFQEKIERKERKAKGLPVGQLKAVQAEILEGECYTPCSVPIAFKFSIKREGTGLRIKWPGFSDWTEYPASLPDIKAPKHMRSGNVEFESLDPARPSARVRVYRVATVYE